MMDGEQITPQPAPSKANIFAALAAARGEYPIIPKNRVATIKSEKAQYSYKYADLSDVFTAIDPILAVNGLTVIQYPGEQNMAGLLVTVIGHESGESIQGTWPIKSLPRGDLGNAQGYQAAIQVAKRYALTAMLGVSTEETVEGDVNRKISAIVDPMNDKFETGDGRRLPVGAKVTADMTPRQIAQEAARAIVEQFRAVKTGKGLSGAWDRNAAFIDKLAEKNDDLYQDLLDVFQTLLEGFNPVAEEAQE
jgi:hypothetical protein